MAKGKEKKKKGGCLKGCLVTVIGVVFCVIILILGIILGPIMKAMEFAQAFMAFFQGETDEEKLYDWVLLNGPNLELSLSAIEGMPYEVSAIEAALECELTCVDNVVYLFDVEDSVGNVVHPQYNLKALTSNYAVPWQLLLAICTANQFGDIDDFIDNLGNAGTEGYRYKVSEQNIKDVYKVIGTKIDYITNYAKYAMADGVRIEDCPTYEELKENCITDLSADNTDKFACIYKETAAGNGIYYPVICLDSVSTWIYNYEFEYELVLDEEGRPIEYKLVNVVKESNIEELVTDLKALGISEDMYEMLYVAIDTMPYASGRNISSMLKKEYNYYKVNNKESFVSNGSYSEHLAIKELYGDMFNATVMNKLRAEYVGNEDVVRDIMISRLDGIKQKHEKYRSNAVNYATKFLYSVYYLPPYKDSNGNTVSYVSGWYNLNNAFTHSYYKFGTPIEDVDFLTKIKYNKDGIVYGMTDWDFICMVLYDSIQFDVSTSYFDTVGKEWKDNDSVAFSAGELLKPMYSSEGVWAAYKDYEHTHFTTAQAFYDFSVVMYQNTPNKNAINYRLVKPNKSYVSENVVFKEDLKIGDLGLRVDNGKVSAVGMYIGQIDGHSAFIHLGGGSSDLSMYQPTVCISYHEGEGVTHPDGGTVNYNTYISIKNGSYLLLGDDGKRPGGSFGWKE